jgi:tetratricopeptide (TPR) repeat protein
LGELEPAKQNLEILLKSEPNDPTARLLLGMDDEELKDYAAGARWLASVPQQVRQRPESIAALARCYYAVGRWDKARATLRELDGPESSFLGGQIAAKAKDFATAERMFASIRATYPNPTQLDYHLALAQYNAGDVKRSETTLRRLISAGAADSKTYDLLAWCYDKDHSAKKAVAAMDRAIQLDPDEASNYLDVGTILLEQHRADGALVAANKAIEADPHSAEAYYLKGRAQEKLGVLKEAVRSYAQSLALDSGSRRALLALALAETNDGQFQAAESTFERGVTHFPWDAIFYQQYARMLLRWKSDPTSEAKVTALLEKAIKLDGSLAETHYELGTVDLRTGRLQQALTQFLAAAKLEPNRAEVHYALSRVYVRLGRRPDAAKEVQIFKRLEQQSSASASTSRK